MKEERTENCNNSIIRACYIFDQFTVEDSHLSLKEIATRCNISVTTAIPVLKAMERSGYLERNPETKQYSLGMKFVEKSQIKINSLNVINCASDILRDFSREHGLNTHLARLDQGDIIYLDRHEAVIHSLSPSYVGKRIPAYCSSLGKAILAFMDEADVERVLRGISYKKIAPNTMTTAEEVLLDLKSTRQRGYAFDDEEYQKNGVCIAVPIFDAFGKVCASISCSMTKTEENESRIPKLVEAMKTAGQIISARIGYHT